MKNALWFCSCLALPLLGALGCSDPVPPPAEGSATMSIGSAPNTDPGYACGVNKTYAVGNPPPDAFNTGSPLVDGQGASVSCTVKGGGTYAFGGSLSAATTAGSIRLQFGGSLTDGMTTYGDGTAWSSDLGDTTISTQHQTDPALQASTMCAFNVINHQIKGGAVWASFNCPNMKGTPTTECQITGQMVFQNCEGT